MEKKYLAESTLNTVEGDKNPRNMQMPIGGILKSENIK
jgi:hypothetical protein